MVTDPVTSVVPWTCTADEWMPFALPLTLNSTLPDRVEGNVITPMPLRVVAPSCTFVDGDPRRTWYRPGDADSSSCENDAVVWAGSSGTAPVVGRMGTSPKTGHPAPERWVRLNPEILSSAKS